MPSRREFLGINGPLTLCQECYKINPLPEKYFILEFHNFAVKI